MPKGYTSPKRLQSDGHYIQGRLAWRLLGDGVLLKRRFTRRFNAPIWRRWVYFAPSDVIYSRDETGKQHAYRRKWALPFLVRLWTATKFDTFKTCELLLGQFKVRASFGLTYLKLSQALYRNWDEVEDYMKKELKINLDEAVSNTARIVQIAFGEALRTANPLVKKQMLELADRANARLVQWKLDHEKGEAGKETPNQLLEEVKNILEKKDNADSTVPGSQKKVSESPVG